MVLVANRPLKRTAFGTRLRQLREAAGLTQTELGERVGIYYQNIAKYERGAVQPNWPMVISLAAALGVTPDAFLGDADRTAFQADDVPPPEEPPARPMGKRK